MKTAINIIILVAMLASVAVQYNDPDGVIWAIIYVYAAIMAVGALRSSYSAPMLFIGAIGYLVAWKTLLPGDLEGWVNSEVARESGGLFIAGLCMIVLIIQMFMAKMSKSEPETT